MIYSIIQKSQLEGAKRLDAEYYQPEYLELNQELEDYGKDLYNFNQILEKVNSLTGGATPLGADYPKEGIKFLRVQNIMPGYIDFNDIVFISEDIHKKQLKRSKLINNDVLLTITGVSYGKSAIYKENFGECNINQHSVRMHFKDVVIPEYVVIFLNSKFGKFQSDRKVTGDTRPALDYKEIRNFKIPVLKKQDQLKIKEFYNNSIKYNQKSKKYYLQAEEILLEELGLKDFEISEQKINIINLSDIKEAKRMDSEYFQEKYDLFFQKINNYKKVLKISDCFIQNTEKIKKDRKFYNYIEIGDVNTTDGSVKFNKVARYNLPANAKIKLRKDNLLISKVRPYRGAVGIVDFDDEDLVGSGAFTVLEEKDEICKKEILMILLRTFIYKDIVMRYNVGSSYPVIKDENILNLPLPILPKEIQDKISKLVKKSFSARKEAKELLKQAKSKVEEMIEKNN